MTANELLALLRRHYLPESRPPGGVFAPEIESPCGKRRADALWMPTTWSGERALVGHEIKVSRSDVLAELADPTKADAWAKYCGRWWLVVSDPKLVEGLTVPEQWGVMSPPSGRRTRSMTELRPAPKLKPVETGPAFRRIAVWLAFRTHTAEEALTRERRNLQRDVEYARREASELRAAGARVGPKDPLDELARRVVERVRADQLRAGRWQELDEEAIAAVLLDLAGVQDATERARRSLETAVRQAQHLTEGVGRMAKELAKVHLSPVEVAS